ncbi:DUF2797 domain-containing protein [Streptomyces sp. NPDC050610]|uniref:DUF2797 domain-containing protein n=1 Tax=Streptomyces sp. NPDC050610 TaxID=3157097 RepID=UPI003448AE9A
MSSERGDWQCTGLRWDHSGPALSWRHPTRGERSSPLPPDRPLAFAFGKRRSCVGVRRGGRHTPCPEGTTLLPSAVSAQCPPCARLDRSHSVAADTIADDPRPYDVYLAWFGPDLIKVGITATEREGVRLLEQAALSYALLGRGPLMSARRAEAVLGAALAVPDRFPYASKRSARHALPAQPLRAAQLADLHERARGLSGLPESLSIMDFRPVHHDAAFHLGRLRPPDGTVEPAAGRTLAGAVAAVAGPDLYITTADGRLLLTDARQLAGWPLGAAPSGAATTVTVRAPAPSAPDALF